MKVLIAIASSERQYKKSLDSCYALARRDGDAVFEPEEFNHGHVTRMGFLDGFRERQAYDALLMLDADQVHPPDMLEKFRDSMEAGSLDMVCGHYYHRGTRVIQSLCFELGDGTWPFMPMLDPPTEGLHEIALTGLGCVLIHRRVVEAVCASMPGDNPFDLGPIPGLPGRFGSDYRFFILARRLGFRLWLRADVDSLHGTTVWLGHKSAGRLLDYAAWANEHHEQFVERLRLHGVNLEAFRQRQRILEARKKGLLADFQKERDSFVPSQELLEQLSVAIYEMDGRLLEIDAWLKWVGEYPPITVADDLPTLANTPPQETMLSGGTDPAQAKAERQADLQAVAADYIPDIPDVKPA